MGEKITVYLFKAAIQEQFLNIATQRWLTFGLCLARKQLNEQDLQAAPVAHPSVKRSDACDGVTAYSFTRSHLTARSELCLLCSEASSRTRHMWASPDYCYKQDCLYRLASNRASQVVAKSYAEAVLYTVTSNSHLSPKRKSPVPCSNTRTIRIRT